MDAPSSHYIQQKWQLLIVQYIVFARFRVSVLVRKRVN